VRNARTVLWGVIGLAAVLRIIPAVRRPLQVDEGYTLRVASLPIHDGLHVLRELDVHPPLDLFIIHALEMVHAPDVVIRLVMALLGVISVVLLYAIVRLWHGTGPALIAAFCAAVMPSLIFYDITIRMWVIFDLLALATFFVLSSLCVRDDLPVTLRRRSWVIWTLLCAALWYTQYLGFVVVAAQILYAAFARRDALVRMLAGAAFAFVLWLPQLPTFLYQLPAGGLAFPSYAGHVVAALYELVGQATIAVQSHGDTYFVAWTSALAWFWLLATLAVALVGNARSLDVWLAAPAALTLLYGLVAHKLLYIDREYLLLAYALCALTGITAEKLARPSGAGRIAGYAAALALAALGIVYAVDPWRYTADWPSVGHLLKTHALSGDAIVLEQGSSFFVLSRGDSLNHHPIIPVFYTHDVQRAIIHAKPFSRLWVVFFQSAPVDPTNLLGRGLSALYGAQGVWQFKRGLPAENVTVVFFERPRPPAPQPRVFHSHARKNAPV
jgi:uncharacterized membrane protein